MSKRYIDAYALENRVEDFEKLTGMKLDIVHDFVSSQPTADVVEVVRCKDCKYGEVDDADFPNQYFCNHHGCAWNEGNHYCSYGER